MGSSFRPPRALPGLCALALFFSGGACAQGLPPAPGSVTNLQRDASGNIIATSPPEGSSTGAVGSAPSAAQPHAGGSSMPACPEGALTCVEVTQSDRDGQAPITFGMPFARGEVGGKTPLLAQDETGNPLPLQLDEQSYYPDGSLRFAVMTTVIPELKPGEHRMVALSRASAAAHNATLPPPVQPEPVDVAVTLYTPQITMIKLGDRKGHDPGNPFVKGETITLKVGGAAAEQFKLVIDDSLAGGAIENYTKLAQAFVTLINGRSKTYRAYRTGERGVESFWVTTTDPGGGAFPCDADYHGRTRVQVTPEQVWKSPRRLSERIVWSDAKSRKFTWLNGPMVKEYDLAPPLADVDGRGNEPPSLAARVHWRAYAGTGLNRFDVIFENDCAYQDNPRNLLYDATISYGGQVVKSYRNVLHYHHSRWHARFWSDGKQDAFVRQEMRHVLRSGATPHYEETLSIPESALSSDAASLAKADTGPMGPALLTTYMPMTGARPDIGPLPRWAVLRPCSAGSSARCLRFATAWYGRN